LTYCEAAWCSEAEREEKGGEKKGAWQPIEKTGTCLRPLKKMGGNGEKGRILWSKGD